MRQTSNHSTKILKRVHKERKQPPDVFLRKGVLKMYNKFTGKHPCLSAISIKLQRLSLKIHFTDSHLQLYKEWNPSHKLFKSPSMDFLHSLLILCNEVYNQKVLWLPCCTKIAIAKRMKEPYYVIFLISNLILITFLL